MAHKHRPVPYRMLSPGFEAVYTGESAPSEALQTDGPSTLLVDDAGNAIRRWSTWTWTWPGQEEAWDEEIEHLNAMQASLGPLAGKTRRLRAHIASLVPCDSGFPVTVDELLQAIGRGELDEPSFHNGCWLPGMWWAEKSTQPLQDESMRAIRDVLAGYLEGRPLGDAVRAFPYARGFIERTYDCLGDVAHLTQLQRLMLERMLLPFEFFTKDSADYQAVHRDCFEEGGRGEEIDRRIAALAGLPPIYPDYKHEFREALATITEAEKRELYAICGHLAHGLHGLSDCHHSTFRWIENWIHAIGTGRWGIPTRRPGTERERLGRLLFGYALGLDRWLLGTPMQFLLLDLGHVDVGFDAKNEILRVYAYLGEERTPVKRWLVACLWRALSQNLGGLNAHAGLVERARQAGVSARQWMDRALAAGAP